MDCRNKSGNDNGWLGVSTKLQNEPVKPKQPKDRPVGLSLAPPGDGPVDHPAHDEIEDQVLAAHPDLVLTR